MTALRPEQDGEAGGFEDAVRRLDDPLNDPLPGQHPSPWFRPSGAQEQDPQPEPQQEQRPAAEAKRRPEPEPEWYDPQGYAQNWYGGGREQAPEPAAPVTAQHTPEQALSPPTPPYRKNRSPSPSSRCGTTRPSPCAPRTPGE